MTEDIGHCSPKLEGFLCRAIGWKYSINVWPFRLFCTCAGFACYGLCIRVQSWLGKVHMVTLHTIWTILVLMLCLTMEGCCALFENGVFNLKLFEFFVDIFNNWIIFRQKQLHFRLQCRPSYQYVLGTPFFKTTCFFWVYKKKNIQFYFHPCWIVCCLLLFLRSSAMPIRNRIKPNHLI